MEDLVEIYTLLNKWFPPPKGRNHMLNPRNIYRGVFLFSVWVGQDTVRGVYVGRQHYQNKSPREIAERIRDEIRKQDGKTKS